MIRRRHFAAALALWRPTLLTAQATRQPPQNAEFEALQAHFEKVVDARFQKLFSGISTVAQWEKRKSEARSELIRMLWHDLKLPSGPPPSAITHREERSDYRIENVVLETIPKLYLTANL